MRNKGLRLSLRVLDFASPPAEMGRRKRAQRALSRMYGVSQPVGGGVKKDHAESLWHPLFSSGPKSTLTDTSALPCQLQTSNFNLKNLISLPVSR